MLRYRYRTETLVGPWRESPLEAEADAVAAGQAMLDGGRGNALVWRVKGEIEVEEDRLERDQGPDRRPYRH